MKSKFILAVLLMAAIALPASAGILKFSAKHIVKPTAKTSFKAAKLGAHGAKKTAKATAKVLY